MNTPSIQLPPQYPIECHPTVAKVLAGSAILLLLGATCILWPALAASAPSAAVGSESAVWWNEVKNAVAAFSR